MANHNSILRILLVIGFCHCYFNQKVVAQPPEHSNVRSPIPYPTPTATLEVERSHSTLPANPSDEGSEEVLQQESLRVPASQRGQRVIASAPDGSKWNRAPQFVPSGLTASAVRVCPGERVNLSLSAVDYDTWTNGTDTGQEPDRLFYHWKASGGSLDRSGSGTEGATTATWTAPSVPKTYTIYCTVNDTSYKSYAQTGKDEDIVDGWHRQDPHNDQPVEVRLQITVVPFTISLSSDKTSICSGAVGVGQYYQTFASNPHQAVVDAKVVNARNEPVAGQTVQFTLASNQTTGTRPSLTSSAVESNDDGIARVVVTSGDRDATGSVTAKIDGRSATKLTFTVGSAEGQWDASAIDTDADGDPIIRIGLSYQGRPVNGHPISWSLAAVKDLFGKKVLTAQFGDYARLSGGISTTGASVHPGEAGAYLIVSPLFGSMNFSAIDTSCFTGKVAAAYAIDTDELPQIGMAASPPVKKYDNDAKASIDSSELRFQDDDGPQIDAINPIEQPAATDPDWFEEDSELDWTDPSGDPYSDDDPDESSSLRHSAATANDLEEPQGSGRYQIIKMQQSLDFGVDGFAKDIRIEQRDAQGKITSRPGDVTQLRAIFDFGERGKLFATKNLTTGGLTLHGTGRMAESDDEIDTRNVVELFFTYLGEDLMSGAARDRIGAFGLGFAYAVRDTVTGTVTMVIHPGETWNGLVVTGQTLKDKNKRKQFFNAIQAELRKAGVKYSESLSGDGMDFSMMNGRIVGELAIIIVGDKGTKIVVKVAKETRLVKEISIVTNSFKLATKAKAVGYVTRIGDMTGLINVVTKVNEGVAIVADGWAGTTASAKQFALSVLKNPSAKVRYLDGAFSAITSRQSRILGYAERSFMGRRVRVPCHYAEVIFGADGKVSRLRLLADKWIDFVCFAAGTKVQMADGSLKDIQSIQSGDMVMSRDEISKRTLAERVLQTFKKDADRTLALTFDDGERIVTTEDHPFYVEDKGFAPAWSLKPGTLISTLSGSPHKLRSAVSEPAATVYNLEVEKTHTYFVGVAALWVHNRCYLRSYTSMAVNSAEKEFERVDEVVAQVRFRDIGTGSETNPSSRLRAREMGLDTDDAGHVIGNNMGGSGGVGTPGNRNIFPQSPNFNRGRYNKFEQKIVDRVNQTGKTANIRVQLEYDMSVPPHIATRPTKIHYRVEFADGTSWYKIFDNPP